LIEEKFNKRGFKEELGLIKKKVSKKGFKEREV
jgi:hypothetical protein